VESPSAPTHGPHGHDSLRPGRKPPSTGRLGDAGRSTLVPVRDHVWQLGDGAGVVQTWCDDRVGPRLGHADPLRS
jgi:hypothetical protein